MNAEPSDLECTIYFGDTATHPIPCKTGVIGHIQLFFPG